MTWRAALVLFVAWMAAGCRGNDYRFALPAPGQPPQVAVQSTTGAIVVSWTPIEEAVNYAVFLSPDPEATPAPSLVCRSGELAASPCVIDRLQGSAPPLQAGQVHYVRVAALVDGFDETESADVGRLPLLEVRPAYEGEAAGPSVWAGLSHIIDVDQVHLQGAWFTDPIETTHTCDDPNTEDAPESCEADDFAVSGGGPGALYREYKVPGTYYPRLDIGSEDGRFGQATTTVTRL